MTVWTIAGIFLTLAAIIASSLASSRKVRNASDFLTGGGKAGPFMVCGTIMGSLVSSQATIGTAQLAFQYGLSAWWFTLGSGLGCLLLALVYVRPLRASGCVTELQIISREYGAPAGRLGSILCSLGIFISVLAQVVACTSLLTALFPRLSFSLAALASVFVMGLYVIFGGSWSAGAGGILKLFLLYVASLTGMAFVLALSGGPGGLSAGLSGTLSGTGLGMIQPQLGLSPLPDDAALCRRFWNLTARGTVKDIGSCLSLMLGVLSTQTYAQAVWSGKTDRAAKRGALLSALLIPPIGAAGISIGLFMRSRYITSAEASALLSAGMAVPDLPVLSGTIQVFPVFVLRHLPSLLGGIILGTLLISVMSGGAGLTLGMATILVKDIWKPFSSSSSPRQELRATRCAIVLCLLCAALVAILIPSSTINDLGFLSMGLRGCVVFLPMTCALWWKGKVSLRCILASILLSPLAVLLGSFLALPFDPLFLGMAISLSLCLLGRFLSKPPFPASP